jgi:hypothetical protein
MSCKKVSSSQPKSAIPSQLSQTSSQVHKIEVLDLSSDIGSLTAALE